MSLPASGAALPQAWRIEVFRQPDRDDADGASVQGGLAAEFRQERCPRAVIPGAEFVRLFVGDLIGRDVEVYPVKP
jgi:hypothetical protein